MLDEATKKALKDSFRKGTLKVRAVDPETSEVGLYPVSDVMQHNSDEKGIFEICLVNGDMVVATEDHSFFVLQDGKVQEIQSSALKEGVMSLVYVEDSELHEVEIESVTEVESRQYMYDLCVPGPENFVLSSGLLAHNSYSIGGISLDISKASQYESLKGNAESQLDKMLEAKTRTVKIIRGLRQQRGGIGVRSAFGPLTGRGIVSPRNYIGF